MSTRGQQYITIVLLSKAENSRLEMGYQYVYVLRCANGDLYTGYTVDPKRRVQLHNLGRASKYTRSRLPVEMVHLERYRSKSKALKREVEIKRMKREQKVKLFLK